MKSLKTRILGMLVITTMLIAQNEEFVLSPVPPHDTLYKLEKQAATLSFSGTVRTISGEFVPTTVTLINKQTAMEYSTKTTSQNNAFTISDVPSGSYILRGVPDYFHYKTTYYSSKPSPDGAYVFDFSDVISEVKFFLLDGMITRTSADKQDSNLGIYPNPFKDQLYLNHTLAGEVKIFDAYEHLVHRIDETQTNINTSTWLPGIYFVKFEDGTVQKCIKE